jgi:hypothetical protein
MSGESDSGVQGTEHVVPDPVRGHHRHRPRLLHALSLRDGVPYEIERVVCSTCGAVIAERTIRRAEA